MINYAGKVGSASVRADIGYMEIHGTANASLQHIRGALSLGFGGVTVGGSYADQSDIDSGKSGTAASDDAKIWDVGVSFATGPFTLGATYWHAEMPLASATLGDDEADKVTLGVQYTMGPGVTALGTLAYVDWSDETTNPANNNNGWALIGGVQVNF